MNTFSVKLDHQLNASNLINERVFYGSNFQSAPAGNSGEIVPPNGPIDMFNSVDRSDDRRAGRRRLELDALEPDAARNAVRLQPLLADASSRTTRSIRRRSASTPARSTRQISACRA